MSVLRSAASPVVARWPHQAPAAVATPTLAATLPAGKPPLWRRALAELIDRLIPLPLVALFFPPWLTVVFLYHLLCDAGPERRSVGKWVCRLRVVTKATGSKATLWQAGARRVGSALSQTAWCCWQWLPWALAFELATLICVLLSPAGQRLEDWLAGTRVVTERAFRHGQATHRALPR